MTYFEKFEISVFYMIGLNKVKHQFNSLDEAINKFKYILLRGKDHETDSNKCKKIDLNPKDVKTLVKMLNYSEYNSYGSSSVVTYSLI